MNAPRQRARLVALVVLTALLFSPPLLLIADASPADPGRLVVYVFVAWGAVIGLTAWLMERRDGD